MNYSQLSAAFTRIVPRGLTGKNLVAIAVCSLSKYISSYSVFRLIHFTRNFHFLSKTVTVAKLAASGNILSKSHHLSHGGNSSSHRYVENK